MTTRILETLLQTKVPKGKWIKPLGGFFSKIMDKLAESPEPHHKHNKMEMARHIQSEVLKQLQDSAPEERPVSGESELDDPEPIEAASVPYEGVEEMSDD